MRIPKWPPFQKRGFFGQESGNTMDLCRLNGLIKSDGGEDCRHPLGQHGLPGAGWTDQKHIVLARRGDLKSPFRMPLAFDIRKIKIFSRRMRLSGIGLYGKTVFFIGNGLFSFKKPDGLA